MTPDQVLPGNLVRIADDVIGGYRTQILQGEADAFVLVGPLQGSAAGQLSGILALIRRFPALLNLAKPVSANPGPRPRPRKAGAR